MEKTLPPRMQQALAILRSTDGTARPSVLATELGISQPHVHTLLGKLLEMGLLVRVPLSYTLTEEGVKVAEEIGDTPAQIVPPAPKVKKEKVVKTKKEKLPVAQKPKAKKGKKAEDEEVEDPTENGVDPDDLEQEVPANEDEDDAEVPDEDEDEDGEEDDDGEEEELVTPKKSTKKPAPAKKEEPAKKAPAKKSAPADDWDDE